MFDIGDYIVYGNNGICKVADITHPDIAGSNSETLYYVLVPEKTRDSKLFCPTDNDRVVLRRIVTAEEAKQLMKEVIAIEPLQVDNERLRDDTYKKAIKSCDLRQCVQMIKTLLIRKQQREANGKKVTATDERYMKLAEDGLYNELAIATGVDREDIKAQILDSLGC